MPVILAILAMLLSGCCGFFPEQSNQESNQQSNNLASSMENENLALVAMNCSQYLPRQNETYSSMDLEDTGELFSCIQNLAIQRNDMEICKATVKYFQDGFILSDWCLGGFAQNKSDLSLCGKRGRAVDRAICRSEILGNYQECFSMECDMFWSCDDQKEICIQSYALSHKNSTICNLLTNEEYRNQCLGLVLLDKSYCNKLADKKAMDSCNLYIDRMPGQNLSN